MKRTLPLLLICMLLLCACAQTQTSSSSSSEPVSSIESGAVEESSSEQTSETSSPATTTEDASEPAEAASSSNILVVYFSATNNTERVAQFIAQDLGADLLELEPVEPYTEEDLDWRDDSSRTSREHEDEALRNVELVQTAIPNWDAYTTVFIGYPIWWGGPAWPIDTFVKANDFSGKIVYPFCTSASSGIGSSVQDLAKMAEGGDWREGMRFGSNASEEEVREWIEGLSLMNQQ